jgi:AcrR family transcriptional regulator
MHVKTKPLRADAERNRRRILDAAGELFAAKGVGVGLDEIAQHAGVGVGTAYRRFPDKDQLIDALFAERVDALVAAAERGLAEPDGWQGLVTFMSGAVELHASDRALKELVFQGNGGEARVAHVRSRMAPLTEEIVRRAHASGELRPGIAHTDLVMLQFMLASLGDFDDGRLWRRALEITLDGLRGDAPLSGEALTQQEFARAVDAQRPKR